MTREAKRFGACFSGHGGEDVPVYGDPIVYDLTKKDAAKAVRHWQSHADTIGGDGIVVERPAMFCAVHDDRVFQFDSAKDLSTFMWGKDLRQWHTFTRFDSPTANCGDIQRKAEAAFAAVR